MEVAFSAVGQALLALGKARYMVSKTGEILPKLVSTDTGRVIETARAVAGNGFNPFAVPFGFLIDGVQMVQVHRGFQKTYRMIETLQQSLGVLQTTTAIVGTGVAVTGVLTAVNLYQTLKLREDVRQLRKELTNGFLDVKQILIEQHAEILQKLDQKALDDRRRELERAYARFSEATKMVGFAMVCQNAVARGNHLANAVQTMSESLAIYNDTKLLPDMNAAGKLRRFECAWTIEQAIALVFQLQNEPIAASKCILDLQQKIRQDTLSVATACESQAELDFIFPEITRIHRQDLMVLEAWQTQIDVLRSLSPTELKQLSNLNSEESEVIDAESIQIPEEENAYNTLKAKADFRALRDQLKFLIKPELRQGYESEIEQLVTHSKYSALIPTNWNDVSDLTVTNLYWYLNNSKDTQKQEAPA
jgi:hypothetical protein